MDANVARAVAQAAHRRDSTRHGEPVIEHVARVAASVPPEARTTAWLHDVLEKSTVTADELSDRGLTAVEAEALALLTRGQDEGYEEHVLRIAHAHGDAGRLARTVKLADLEDHMGRRWAAGDPPYGWAHRHILNAADRIDRGPVARAVA
jgi:hypothetical protein